MCNSQEQSFRAFTRIVCVQSKLGRANNVSCSSCDATVTASRCSLTSLRVYADIVGRNAFGQKKMNIKPCVSIHCNIQTAQQHLNKDMMTTESKPSLLNKDM